MNENEIGSIIFTSALELHKNLGPGLFESVYESIMSTELEKKGLSVQRQVLVPLIYKGIHFETCFRADMVVNKKVLIELKSVDRLHDLHKKQVLTYLKLTRLKLGYLINFNSAFLRHGIIRVINGAADYRAPVKPN